MSTALALGLCAVWFLLPEYRFQDSSAEDRENDSDYGKTWMYFPDGDGVPRVVNLTDSPHEGRGGNTDMYITFQLYTRRNKDVYSELVMDSSEEEDNVVDSGRPFNDDNFDPKKEVKILTHGWLSSGQSPAVLLIKDAYLEDRDCNVIVVDWEPLSTNYFYFLPAYNTRYVGRKTGRLVDYLITQQGLSLDQFHIIGHSLGSHVSGYAGSFVKSGKIARITGLDPAKPGFENTANADHRLDETDAKFVDVIHTAAGVLGYWSPLGDADFYPNGGTPPQPGCGGITQMLEACSHSRSYEYFAESIRKPFGFKSAPCSGANEARSRQCPQDNSKVLKEDDKIIVMGDRASAEDKGVFYLTTNSEAPYSEND